MEDWKWKQKVFPQILLFVCYSSPPHRLSSRSIIIIISIREYFPLSIYLSTFACSAMDHSQSEDIKGTIFIEDEKLQTKIRKCGISNYVHAPFENITDLKYREASTEHCLENTHPLRFLCCLFRIYWTV